MYCEVVTPRKNLKISSMIVLTVWLFKQYPGMDNADKHVNIDCLNSMTV